MTFLSLVSPVPAATWLQGPPTARPRMAPEWSPITALVDDWPPSTPKKKRPEGITYRPSAF